MKIYNQSKPEGFSKKSRNLRYSRDKITYAIIQKIFIMYTCNINKLHYALYVNVKIISVMVKSQKWFNRKHINKVDSCGLEN